MTNTDNLIQIRIQQTKPVKLDVSLEINDCETLVLVGPSGSGKTRVLRAIAGLDQPDTGSIIINKRSWFDSSQGINLATQKRSIAYVFQDYALFPHKTARENVKLALDNCLDSDQKFSLEQIFKMTHLHGLEDRLPRELSGGQKQRVALARAIARGPDLLLLDEPFSSLDQLTKQKLIREIQLLKSKLSIPIILVTHDLDEARMLSDQISVIHHGKTLQQGETSELLNGPVNRRVARLTGHQNIFEGVIKEQNPLTNTCLLETNDGMLECEFNDNFNIGDKVDWLISESGVVMHRVDRPSRGEKENPVAAVVTELLTLGDTSHVRASSISGSTLYFTVSNHVIRRNRIDINSQIKLSLLSDSIHLMKQSKL